MGLLSFLSSLFGGGSSQEGNAADTSFQKGFIFFKKRRYDKAKEEFQKVLAQNPNHYESLVCLGQVFVAESNDSEAVSLFERAATLRNQDSQLFVLLACSYGVLDQFDRAEAAFKRALEIDPENEEAREALAIYYAKLR